MSNIRYADDKALVANSHKRVTLLQQLLLITWIWSPDIGHVLRHETRRTFAWNCWRQN